MNRRARRNAMREELKADKTLMFKKGDLLNKTSKIIEDEREKIKHECAKQAVNTLMGATLISLHDEFGFSTKRLNKLIDKINNNFECVKSGTVSINDFNDWCIEKGINFDISRSGRGA